MPGEQEERKLTIHGAMDEVMKIYVSLGVPKLKVAQQMLGFAVKVIKEEGFELGKLLNDITRHWNHVRN